MNIVILVVLFGLFGAAIGEGEGMLLGALLGAALGGLLDTRKRLGKLEKEQHALLLELRTFRLETEQRLKERVEASARRIEASSPLPYREPVASEAPSSWTGPPGPSATSQVAEQEAAELAATVSSAPSPAASSAPAEEGGTPFLSASSAPSPSAGGVHESGARPAPLPSRDPAPWQSTSPAPLEPLASTDPFDAFAARVRDLLFGGNTIVRVGILVLLVGVSLLLRWAAEHSVFPIELRMASAGVLAMVLVGFGYHQRELRPGFGRTLQGGGIAALYLVVFFSFRRYELLPGGLAFALLVTIALSSGLLAVLQDSRALVVIGQIGGFMAPVLASTGAGSHVALFSYYLLLNVLVFVVAWFKPWRALNLVGFAFTFGIGSSWGALRYRPEDFASTEPFLLAFFLLYSMIPVLYAVRRPDEKRGWVDASLVFGTPLAVLLLQYALVSEKPFGMAYSALGLAAFYVLLSRVLLKRAPDALRSLVEAFLAIGVGFATLAIPYGFDNHDLTGASWALEGAGLYWVGGRQNRWLSRLAGATLQLLACGALLVQLTDGQAVAGSLPLANARFLASSLVALSCLFVARQAYTRVRSDSLEAHGLQLLIALGLGFFLGAAQRELTLHVARWLQPGFTLALLTGTALLLELAGRKLAWLPGRLPAVLTMLLLLPTLLLWELEERVQPLAHGGLLGFPLGFALCVLLLRRFVADAPWSRQPLHCVFLWFTTALVILELTHLVSDSAQLNQTWAVACVGLSLSLALVLTVRGSASSAWPFREAVDVYLVPGAGALAATLVFWTLWSNASLAGDPAPLPYLPLLHPLDVAQLVALAAGLYWQRALTTREQGDPSVRAILLPMLGALAFFWFNALLARSVHMLAGVPFDADLLWAAVPMQVSVSISWSVLGLLGTVLGSRKQRRWLWLLGATLLGVVVLKLFTVDLAQLSTLAKIGTFMVVGLLLVLVGYFAPVPPPRSQPPESGKV